MIGPLRWNAACALIAALSDHPLAVGPTEKPLIETKDSVTKRAGVLLRHRDLYDDDIHDGGFPCGGEAKRLDFHSARRRVCAALCKRINNNVIGVLFSLKR